jgi:hypothetical protein
MFWSNAAAILGCITTIAAMWTPYNPEMYGMAIILFLAAIWALQVEGAR